MEKSGGKADGNMETISTYLAWILWCAVCTAIFCFIGVYIVWLAAG